MIPLHDKLSLMTEPALLTQRIDEAGSAFGWWPAGRQWRRIYGRVEQRQPIVRMVYETSATDSGNGFDQALCSIELFDRQTESDSATQCWFYDALLGWMRLTRFPCDARLASLATLMREQRTARVMRYRPGKRCTLRIKTHHGQMLFAKVFPDQRGKQVHEDSVRLAQAQRRGRGLGFRVAAPRYWDEEQCTVWQGRIPGAQITARTFDVEGPRLAVRMGYAAASLPCSTLETPSVFDREAQMRRSQRYAQRLAELLPDSKQPITELMGRLRQAHQDAGWYQPRPIHGALHSQQWLDDGERLGLVDFDRFCLGDPELDAATFIADLDYENPKHTRGALIDAFLGAYQRLVGPLDNQLMQAYRAHKHLSKALKAAQSVRPDRLDLAQRNLRRALHHVAVHQQSTSPAMFSF